MATSASRKSGGSAAIVASSSRCSNAASGSARGERKVSLASAGSSTVCGLRPRVRSPVRYVLRMAWSRYGSSSSRRNRRGRANTRANVSWTRSSASCDDPHSAHAARWSRSSCSGSRCDAASRRALMTLATGRPAVSTSATWRPVPVSFPPWRGWAWPPPLMSAAGLPATTCDSTVADAPCGASSAAAQSTGTAAARRKLRRFMSSRSVACRALRVVWRPYPTTTPPHADPSRLDLFPEDSPSSPRTPLERREAIGPLGVLRGRA